MGGNAMRLKHLSSALAVAALAARLGAAAAGRRRRTAIYVPLLHLPHRAVRRLRHPDRQRHARLSRRCSTSATAASAASSSSSRNARPATTPRRASNATSGQGQEAGRHQSLFDRHHAAADPEGRGRQDPGPVDGLWPLGLGGSATNFPWVFNPPATYWDGLSMIFKLHRRQGRRPRQAQGQDHRLHLLRRRLRPRADPAARAVRQGLRLQGQALSGAGSRNAEPVGAVAQRPPRPAGLDDHVGLGRDEPDRRQGSRQDQLPDGQVRRHLVVGRRGRRAPGRRRRQGLSSRSTSTASAPNYPGDPGHP